jgi:uncharacterized protein YebE (UPF0316 family)
MTLPGSEMWLVTGIFLAEMCVVTLGTLRIIFIARNRRALAPVLGFFEVMTWLFAIGQTMQHLDNLVCCLAFALGFTAGNFLGMYIEKKLAMGFVHVRIITHRDAGRLTRELGAANFGYTCVDGTGAMGPVRIVMTVVRRRQLDDLLQLVETCQPGSFYAVDELQSASAGVFPATTARAGLLPSVFHWRRRANEYPGAFAASGIMMAASQHTSADANAGRNPSSQAA